MRTTFERIDLKQYDGHTTGPWEVDPTPETQSGGDFQARILARRAFDDGADAVITGFPLHGNRNDYSNIHFEPNARLIAAAPDLLAALRAAYAEIDRLRAKSRKIPATLPDAEDKVLVVSRGAFTAHLAALKAAYAESDRLRAYIAADARNRCERCGVKIVDHTLVCGAPQCCPACCREATLEAEIAEWEDKSRKMQAEIDRLSANGDRWAYIPEVQP